MKLYLFLLFEHVFHQQHFPFQQVFIWVSNLNLSMSLLKSEDIAKVHDQNFLHATLKSSISIA